jgi:NifU-like protein involved in Fe-S cluster formation
MYTEQVMDHFMNPRNVGEVEDPSGVGTVGNAKCGDIMNFPSGENNVITDVKLRRSAAVRHRHVSRGTEMSRARRIDEALQITNKMVARIPWRTAPPVRSTVPCLRSGVHAPPGLQKQTGGRRDIA